MLQETFNIILAETSLGTQLNEFIATTLKASVPTWVPTSYEGNWAYMSINLAVVIASLTAARLVGLRALDVLAWLQPIKLALDGVAWSYLIDIAVLYGVINLFTADTTNIFLNSWLLRNLTIGAILVNMPYLFPVVKVFTDGYTSGDTFAVWFDTVLIVALQYVPDLIFELLLKINISITKNNSALLANGFFGLLQAIPLVFKTFLFFVQFSSFSGVLYGIPFGMIAFYNLAPALL